ncbi:MAG: trypsin-like peptidase domain-containing protein [Gammaproteobacteria bacterium]|nr:trypsin-like peptidase domain-containing protein [Gammaproteobacteria bacterium]
MYSDFNEDEEGFPFEAPQPRPYNLAPKYTYFNQLVLPEKLRNIPVNKIQDNPNFSFTQNPIQSTALLVLGAEMLGTAVLISPNKAVIARHCFKTDRDKPLRLLMGPGSFFKISEIEHDPDGLDVSIVTLEGMPGNQYGYTTIALEEQPKGRHFMIHYAGGGVKQISTGDFLDSNYWHEQHSLFINGGPIASGAGIYNITGKLIGINVYRTGQYLEESRQILLLAYSSLFSYSPIVPMYQHSVVRPYYPKSYQTPPLTTSIVKTYNKTVLPNLPAILYQFESLRPFAYDRKDGYETYDDDYLLRLSDNVARGLSIQNQKKRNDLIRNYNAHKHDFLDSIKKYTIENHMACSPFSGDFKQKHVQNGTLSKRDYSHSVAVTRHYPEEFGLKNSSVITMSDAEGWQELMRSIYQLSLENFDIIEEKPIIKHGTLFWSQEAYPLMNSTVVFSRPDHRKPGIPEREKKYLQFALKIEGGMVKIHHLHDTATLSPSLRLRPGA